MRPVNQLPAPSQTLHAMPSPRCDQRAKTITWNPGGSSKRHRLTHQIDLSPSAFWASLLPNPAPWGWPDRTVTQAEIPSTHGDKSRHVLGASCMSGKNYCDCSTGDVGRSRAPCGAKSPGRTRHGTWPRVWVEPKGLPPPQHSGARAGCQGRGLRGGGSESASRAQHMLHFTFFGEQCPMMSVSTQAVWISAF